MKKFIFTNTLLFLFIFFTGTCFSQTTIEVHNIKFNLSINADNVTVDDDKDIVYITTSSNKITIEFNAEFDKLFYPIIDKGIFGHSSIGDEGDGPFELTDDNSHKTKSYVHTFSTDSNPVYLYVDFKYSHGNVSDLEGYGEFEIKFIKIIPVTGISLSNLTITKGGTKQLTPGITPANATDKSVTWKSANTNIATVNNSGYVTGINPGTTTITATTNDGGYKATSTVIVNEQIWEWQNEGNLWRDYSISHNGTHKVEVKAAEANWPGNGYVYHNDNRLGYGSGVLGAADNNGIVYLMNSSGQIYKWRAYLKEWEYITGSGKLAQDFTVGGNRVYIIKKNNGNSGLVYRWEGANNWQQMYWGTGVKIAAGNSDDDNLWLINDWNRVYKFTRQGNSGWTEITGQYAKDIDIYNNEVFILGTDNKVYVRDGSQWREVASNVPAGCDRIVKTGPYLKVIKNSGSNNREIYRYVQTNARVAAGGLQIQQNDSTLQTKPTTEIGLNENFSVKLYPNPVVNIIRLAIYSSNSSNAQLYIFDSKGSEILSSKENLKAGENALSKDLSGFNPGVYFIKVIASGSLVYRDKFVIEGN